MSNTKIFVAGDVKEENHAPLDKAGIAAEKRIKLEAEELVCAVEDFGDLIARRET